MKYRFNDLCNQCPEELQKRIEGLKFVEQRPDFHPEGNVWIHTQIVVNRLVRYRDQTLSWAALFHDIGKDVATKKNDEGLIRAIGHEDVSAELVWEYRDFLAQVVPDVKKVEEIVKNHMRIKLFDQMRLSKQMEMRRLSTFGLLQVFCLADDMTTLTEKELLGLERVREL